VRYPISDATISEETPTADSAPQARTAMLLPAVAARAARRPSRIATRTMLAVAGPGVSVTKIGRASCRERV